MEQKRTYSDKAKKEAQKRATTKQIEFGFGSAVPTRKDAKALVEERKKGHTKEILKKTVPPKKETPPKKRDSLLAGASPTFVWATIILFLILSIGTVILRSVEASTISPFIEVTVDEGMSARQIATLLEEYQVVEDGSAFEQFIEQHDATTKLQSGTFEFGEKEEFPTVLERLIQHSSTLFIYPGYTVERIDQLLVDRALSQAGEFIQSTKQVAQQRGLPFVEGWFLSGEYPITDPLSLATMMQDRLNEALLVYLNTIEKSDYSLAEIVVIASMIQRETNTISQMPLIAQVIYNRLNEGMSLGIDATLRYALDVWSRPFTPKERSSETPFNTHNRVGLPPGGIGAVSLEALDAAMYPAIHPYLFYIHDKEGNLHLSKSYEEHKELIQRYLQ